MKKINYLVLSMMMVLACATAFTACGSDDDDNGGAGGIVGTWTETETYEYDTYTMTFCFNSDGTGWYRESTPYYPGKTQSFTYTVSGNVLTLILDDSYSGTNVDMFHFLIKGNKLYLYDYDDGWKDLEWELTRQ